MRREIEALGRTAAAPALACIAVLLSAAAPCLASAEDTATCISAQEQAWVRKTYEGYRSRYDLAIVARELVDLDHVARKLDEQLETCRKNADRNEQAHCDLLARQLEANRGEQARVSDRFGIALKMEQYLSSLEDRLRRPLCGE